MKNLDQIKNKNIIINTDIDGVLSGLLLTNYLDCHVVGFSNSEDIVWFDPSKIKTMYDAVYIDMFVADPSVVCIDQHIISVNKSHHDIISDNINKWNPNIDNPRFHFPDISYYNKYPFGTVLYIISILEEQGIVVHLDLFKSLYGLNFADILLRADDTMKTSIDSNYKDNAKSWWKWLYKRSNKSKSIFSLVEYLYKLTPEDVDQIKVKTTSLFKNTFECSSPDGGYKMICDSNGELLPKVIAYLNCVSSFSSLQYFDLNLKLISQKGNAKRLSLNEDQERDLLTNNQINGEHIFSYAFVRSSNREENFSYTIM